MHHLTRTHSLGIALAAAAAMFSIGARAQETIKVGMSLPLSGTGAAWGKSAEWMCKKAAQEIKEAGGVKVKGEVRNFECIAYDNKYTAAEGTKVTQTLLNRDGVKYMQVMGTAPILASQALTERQGVLLFNFSWGMSSKGPKYPMTFAVLNSLVEIMPSVVQFITKANPQAKTIALLNANDASGRENESISNPLWQKAGLKVMTSDFYERGTTEFQPIAARLAALKPDIIDLASAPPADAGQIFKELETLGFKGIKVTDNGTGIDGLVTIGGSAVNNVYMAAAIPFDGPSATDHQRKLNTEARAQLGEGLNLPAIGAYDGVYMLKAGIEKAQTIEPRAVAAVLPSVKYRTFYGGETVLGGKDVYGATIQPILPVYITQIVNGKVVEKARIELKKN
jgi:branched-chain amino acid transport system substrate-binding protein